MNREPTARPRGRGWNLLPLGAAEDVREHGSPHADPAGRGRWHRGLLHGLARPAGRGERRDSHRDPGCARHRSRRSWGHGDLRDLADLAGWSARELGAGFVLINPLHAAEPLPPVSPSPYLPMTRRYVSPLYLRIEDIAEYQRLDARQRERIDTLAAPLRGRNATADLIDRDAVWAAQRAALEIIRRAPLSDRRREEYQRFRRREGRDLEDWATWCALAERYGPDWRAVPGPAPRPPPAAGVTAPPRPGLHPRRAGAGTRPPRPR